MDVQVGGGITLPVQADSEMPAGTAELRSGDQVVRAVNIRPDEIPSEVLADSGPAQSWQKDDETLQVPALFGVESYAGASEGWVLECRIDEAGWGSPLVWTDKQKALERVVEAAKEGGWDCSRVVVFRVSTRIAAIAPCAACGEHGHTEDTCPAFPPQASGLTPGGSCRS